MASWPDVTEVEQLLDLGDEDWITDHLQHALDGAIARVKEDAKGADWDDLVDEPSENQRQAALRAVQVMRVNAPDDGWRSLDNDHIYQSLIKGTRRTWGVA